MHRMPKSLSRIRKGCIAPERVIITRYFFVLRDETSSPTVFAVPFCVRIATMIHESRVIDGYIHVVRVEVLIRKNYHEPHKFWSIRLHSSFAHNYIDAIIEDKYFLTAFYILSGE